MRARSDRSLAAEAAFRARLAELGAELLEPAWLGDKHPHRVRCAAGHECAPRPGNMLHGQGPCGQCRDARDRSQDPKCRAAEAAFRARLAELGAVLLEPRWLGANTPHRVRCAAGHECRPRPHSIANGRQGICRPCAGFDPAAAEAAFRTRLAELGAVLLEPRWLGVMNPHRVRCVAGHECRPRPAGVVHGRQGVCLICARRDPAAAEAAFRARLAELGAELLEPAWLGAHTPHLVRCAAGHASPSRPRDVANGDGICRTCAGTDPAVAEAKFREILGAAGATLLEPAWLGSHVPHRVRCADGHEVNPHPGSILRGTGICRKCAGKDWDAFYVVTDSATKRIKFGITSGNARPRLAHHRGQGYREVVRLLTGLPGMAAPELERAIIAALSLAGEKPVKGREHYDISALALVLDVADNYPLPQAV